MKNDLNLGLIFCFIFEQLLDHLISGNFEIIIHPLSFHILDFPCSRVPPLVVAVPPLAHIQMLIGGDCLAGSRGRDGDGLIKLDFIFEIFAPATAATR